MSYLDENGLAEFTTKIKAYFEKKFYGENVLLTTDDEMLQTSDGMFLNFTPAPQPQEEYFLTFSSSELFRLYVRGYLKSWDGTLEYSTDKIIWTTWDGTDIYSASDGTKHNLYVRGIGNTIISGDLASATSRSWYLAGGDINCSGNVENLLDYQTVMNGNHPPMANYCFRYWLSNNPSLISCPQFLSNALALRCYSQALYGCSNLITLPKLSATNLNNFCYAFMFGGCSKIKLSTTQTGEYVNEYRIPETGTGTDSSNANGLTNMFANTGGTFTGTPTINTTYYTSNEVV